MAANRQMKLGATLSSSGEHAGVSRHKDTPAQTRASFRQYSEPPKAAEAALPDLILLGDVSTSNDAPAETSTYNAAIERLDPFMLTAALAATCRRIRRDDDALTRLQPNRSANIATLCPQAKD